MTITFASGLPGFEECRRYVLVQSDEFDPAVCLKGLEGPAPAFLLVDPRRVDPKWTASLSAADAVRLGAARAEDCVWLVMVSAAGDEPRVNLGAPVVIHPATMRGIQLVPAEGAGPVDRPWSEATCSS